MRLLRFGVAGGIYETVKPPKLTIFPRLVYGINAAGGPRGRYGGAWFTRPPKPWIQLRALAAIRRAPLARCELPSRL